MRISDWSSDVCSSDLLRQRRRILTEVLTRRPALLAYTLGALFFLNTMNFVDRLLFSVVQELIKPDLALSDFELGLLGGPAFAILYSRITFPIARDRKSPRLTSRHSCPSCTPSSACHK